MVISVAPKTSDFTVASHVFTKKSSKTTKLAPEANPYPEAAKSAANETVDDTREEVATHSKVGGDDERVANETAAFERAAIKAEAERPKRIMAAAAAAKLASDKKAVAEAKAEANSIAHEKTAATAEPSSAESFNEKVPEREDAEEPKATEKETTAEEKKKEELEAVSEEAQPVPVVEKQLAATKKSPKVENSAAAIKEEAPATATVAKEEEKEEEKKEEDSASAVKENDFVTETKNYLAQCVDHDMLQDFQELSASATASTVAYVGAIAEMVRNSFPSADADITELGEKMSVLKKKNQDLQAKLFLADEETVKLNTEKKHLETKLSFPSADADITELGEKMSVLKKKNQDLQAKLFLADEETVKLNTEKKHLETKLSDFEGLQAKYQELEMTCSLAVDRIADSEELQAKNQELEAKCELAVERIVMLQDDKKQLETKHSDLQEDMKQAETNYSDLQLEKKVLETKYSNLQNDKKKLETKLSDLQNEKKELENKCAGLRNEKNQIETQHWDLTRTISAYISNNN